MYGLGSAYMSGRGTDKDEMEAIRWYLMAAESGYAKAQNTLGVCYKNGTGVEKDLGEAVKWYRLAAQQNYALAQSNLGICYAKGEGVERNDEEASFWFTLAEENGNESAREFRDTVDPKLSAQQRERVAERVKLWQTYSR